VEEDGDQRIRDVMSPIAPHTIVSADAPVTSLLEWIEQPGMLFVVEGNGFSGFITVSDFNKQPARAYLYILLATLEMRLAELLRDKFRDDQVPILERLPPDTANEIYAMYEADVEENIEADVVSYLSFGNVVNAVAKDANLLALLGRPSRRSWEQRAGKLVELRNDVMHPTRSLVTGKLGLIELRERERDLQYLLEVTASVKVGAAE
jgi:hypothetical protein